MIRKIGFEFRLLETRIEINENPGMYIGGRGYLVVTSHVAFSVGENVERNGWENFVSHYLGSSIRNLIISVYVPNEFLIFHRNDVEISADD